jgi:hypothetical protein
MVSDFDTHEDSPRLVSFLPAPVGVGSVGYCVEALDITMSETESASLSSTSLSLSS